MPFALPVAPVLSPHWPQRRLAMLPSAVDPHPPSISPQTHQPVLTKYPLSSPPVSSPRSPNRPSDSTLAQICTPGPVVTAVEVVADPEVPVEAVEEVVVLPEVA